MNVKKLLKYGAILGIYHWLTNAAYNMGKGSVIKMMKTENLTPDDMLRLLDESMENPDTKISEYYNLSIIKRVVSKNKKRGS